MDQHTARGGARPGAGRPLGTGNYKEPTQVVRLPTSQVATIKAWLKGVNASNNVSQDPWSFTPYPKAQTAPLFTESVAAGFPSPADDYIEQTLDLNDYLVEHPAATFFLRVHGDSMINAGIFNNDILVVDRSLEARHGKIIIAVINGELTVKRLRHKNDQIWLDPENNAYPPLQILEGMDFSIWGVVVHVLHSFK